MKVLTLEKYIEQHPDIKFSFAYDPHGASFSGDTRCWQVKFSKPIKNNHLCGYACETYKELIDAIVNERD